MAVNYALILAGGSGNRLQQNTPKAFLKINNLYILEHSILKFNTCASIDKIILVIPKGFAELTTSLVLNKKYKKVVQILVGGSTRFKSSQIGIHQIKEEDARVLIHDAARPFISENIIENCLNELNNYDAVNVLAPITDSLVLLHQNNITKSANRQEFRQVQTPQGFSIQSIKKAHRLASEEQLRDITDDFNLVLKYNTGSTSWIKGERMNFKITYEEDLEMANRLLTI